ncbi:MAG: hypothetical protein IPM54_03165 [Polyangiaceae bacterium]|nr:hypothetical protein [Polyangiaceae bacterium]
MSFKKFLALLAAIVFLGVSAFAQATTMLFLTREELTLRSDIVARVRVGKAAVSESDDGRMIVTRTELVVTKLLKGKVQGPIVVQQFGGTFRGKTQKVVGDGQLRPGEDAVVFLRRDDKGKTYLTGLALSVYHIDDKGMARRYVDDMVFMKYEDGKVKRMAHVELPEPVESLMTDIVRFAGGK